MFAPFTQTTTDRTGAGLGLSISRKSVQANGGQLSVRNVAETGCIFTIDLLRHLQSQVEGVLEAASIGVVDVR